MLKKSLQKLITGNLFRFQVAQIIFIESISKLRIYHFFSSKSFLVFILFSLSFSSSLKSQSKPFSAYEKALDTIVKKYDTKHQNYKYLKLFVDNFKNAKKADVENLTKVVTGVGFYLNYENKDLDMYPAIFSHKNGKVDISGIRSSVTIRPSEEMKEYVNIYLNDWKKIGYTKTFKWMITNVPIAESKLTEMSSEHKVNGYEDISFIRGDNDWMYAISYGDFGIGVYAFKLSLADEEISGSKVIAKIQEEKDIEFREFLDNYPFAHYTNRLNTFVNHLRERSTFSKDQSFLKNTESIKKELDRKKLVDYVPMFNYFLELKFPAEMLIDNNENIDKFGIKHLSAHTLGDYYFSQKNYNKAVEYYKKSILDYPPDDDVYKIRDDANMALLSIAKAYQHQNKRNEAYTSLLSIFFSRNKLYSVEEKLMNKYLSDNKEDNRQFKMDLEKALVTIKKIKENYYSFTFRKVESFFYTDESVDNKSNQIKLSNFYKSLN